MAESAIEKLLRLKKEKSSAQSAGADSNGSPNSTNTTSSTNTHSVDSDYKKVETTEPEKPMSAMEKLRAIKMGGSSPTQKEEKKDDTSTIHDHLPTSVHNVSSDAHSEVAEPEKILKEEPKVPPKERKTHPLAMEMAELEEALDNEVPGFVSILSTIHKKLKADPECVTLLDDEEIGRIVAGLEKHTNVTIVSPNAVKAAKKASKVPVTAADL